MTKKRQRSNRKKLLFDGDFIIDQEEVKVEENQGNSRENDGNQEEVIENSPPITPITPISPRAPESSPNSPKEEPEKRLIHPPIIPQLTPKNDQPSPRLRPADWTNHEPVLLKTNSYEERLNRSKEIYRYDVTAQLILIDREIGSIKDLTKGPRDDGEKTRRNELIHLSLKFGLELYGIVGLHCYYISDDAAILYASECLDESLKPYGEELSVKYELLPSRAKELINSMTTSEAQEVKITIHSCRLSSSRFTLGDLMDGVMNGGDDRPLRQFLELLTSQSAVNSGKYTLFGSGKAFANGENSRRSIPNTGHERRDGITKGQRFVEGKKETGPVAALVLDAKIGTFYRENNVLNTVMEINRWRHPSHVIWTIDSLKRTHEYLHGRILLNSVGKAKETEEGVRVRIDHMGVDRGTFRCQGLHFNEDGSYTSAEEYIQASNKRDFRNTTMAEKWRQSGTPLHYPKWPLVIQSVPKANNNGVNAQFLHPMEHLIICDHQRVAKHKAMASPERAAKPDVRFNEITKHLDSLELTADPSKILESFGVQINPKAIEVIGHRRKAPLVSYARQNTPVDDKKCSWMSRRNRYSLGSRVGLILITWNHEKERRQGDTYRASIQLAEILKRDASNKGIIIEEIRVIHEPFHPKNFQSKNINTADGVFLQAKEWEKLANRQVTKRIDRKYSMIIYIDSMEVAESHRMLKLAESFHQITTQHINTSTIMSQNSSTVENLLAKLNMKLGGLNHTVQPQEAAHFLWNSRTLVIGYDVAHPTGSMTVANKALGAIEREPSVVGFSANCTAHRDAFIGDFSYHRPRCEKVDDHILNERMHWVLKMWMERRGDQTLPEIVFVLRDGVSEGQYKMVIKEETEAIREACHEFLHGYKPKIVVVICTKRHNKRFAKVEHVPGRRDFISNPDPLTVVDQHVVQLNHTELFIQSHCPPQGTAKPTEYELLVNDLPESQFNQSTLQDFIIALCFEHQISGRSISLPEPVYQADEWAKRGSDLWKAYHSMGFPIPYKPQEGTQMKEIDWKIITQRLSYMGKKLDGIRVNA